MRRFASVFLLLLTFLAMAAEDKVRISGTVTDDTGKSLASVIVKTDAKGVGFVMTKADGSYAMEIDSEEPSLTLTFSKLGYESEKATVERRTQRFDMTMSKTASALPEVTVSNPEVRLRGDTISFLLAAFAGKGDVSLKDALKKVPGVEVSASGEISYNGKKISNFYIEGMDLMGGKYDLATSNIPASYVNAIEILNNHKDRKIDRNLYSDNVALNVRLKPKAKFRPTGTYGLSAGIGDNPMPLAASGAGMLFRESFQSMLTLKGSDIREFSAREHNRLLNYGESDAGNYTSDILGRLSASTPPLSRDRWIRPIDASATANFINKTGKDATLRGDAGYSFVRNEYSYSNSRIYFDGGHDVMIEQLSNPLSRTHRPSLSLEYKVNSDDYYLFNYFSGDGAFSTDIVPVSAATNHIRQREQLRSFNLSDVLDLSWQRGKLRWTFSSSIRFKSTPKGSIEISESTERQEDDIRSLCQTAHSRYLSVKEGIAAIREIRSSRFSLPLDFHYSYSGIRTALDYHGYGPTEAINHLQGHSFQASLSPTYDFQAPYDRFVLRTSIPLRLHSIDWTNTGTTPERTASTYLLTAPNLYLNYKISAKSLITMTGSWSNSVGDILDLLTAPVMTDYLSMRYRSGRLSKSRTLQASLRYDFKLPLSFWYVNADVRYSNTRCNLMSRQQIGENLIEVSDFHLPNNSETIGGSLGISKRIRSIATKISLKGGYSVSHNRIEQAGQIIGYRADNAYAKATISSRPWSWMELAYDGDLSVVTSSYLERRQSFTSQTHDIGLSFFPLEGFELKLSSSVIRKEIEQGRHQTVPLFDIKGVYSFRKFRLTGELRNMLNRRSYSYTLFTGLDRFTYDYRLRGRELILSVDFKM